MHNFLCKYKIYSHSTKLRICKRIYIYRQIDRYRYRKKNIFHYYSSPREIDFFLQSQQPLFLFHPVIHFFSLFFLQTVVKHTHSKTCFIFAQFDQYFPEVSLLMLILQWRSLQFACFNIYYTLFLQVCDIIRNIFSILSFFQKFHVLLQLFYGFMFSSLCGIKFGIKHDRRDAFYSFQMIKDIQNYLLDNLSLPTEYK